MELWRSEPGGGKTHAVIELVQQVASQHPLQRIWVVLPTSRQRAAFRDRLLQTIKSHPAPTFNVELFNFHTLTRRVLNLIGEPVRSLTPAARQHLLRQIAAHTPLNALAEGAAQPGFAAALGKLIGELKADQITPEVLQAAAHDHGAGKDHDIARLYAAYQETLRRNGLVDTEGETWLALARLYEINWNPHLELLIVDGFDLEVREGEAIALTGRNGAGKSTILRCLVGADTPDEGTVEVNGIRMSETNPDVRRNVATVIDDLDFFPDLSVVEHLDLLARAHGVPDPETAVDEVLHEVQLVPQSGQLPGTLSSGQRRRLALATAFVRPRKLLVLDEPEQRLDVEGVEWLAARLAAERSRGLAIVLASHEPRLVDVVATRVVRVGSDVVAGEVGA